MNDFLVSKFFHHCDTETLTVCLVACKRISCDRDAFGAKDRATPAAEIESESTWGMKPVQCQAED